ncbi:MAG: roadblock/LC7 domain-containing protein, partial [Candidatus Thorarchaeota archaeon]
MKKGNEKNIFDDLLKKLLAAIPEVKAAAIVSAEGLPIASALPHKLDETRVAAMTAALLSLSERAIIEMNKGDFDQLNIKGSEGYLLILNINPNSVLIVSADKDVHLGLTLLGLRRSFGGDDFPYPYIFKPPGPGDLGAVTQAQIKPKVKDSEYKTYCQYCGKEILKEEQFHHNCR